MGIEEGYRRHRWHHERMPMREECKHFQSRTYADGETARFCVLDLAPEAPWRCPDNCPRYERRLADVAWQHGTLIDPSTPAEPEMTPDVSTLLDEAENIVNRAGPDIIAEEDRVRERASGTWWDRFRSSFRRPR
jgi:hypothetical protein